MNAEQPDDSVVEQLTRVGEALRDANLFGQDLLDELEEQQIDRWEAYAGFRRLGARFRAALDTLRPLHTSAELAEAAAVYLAGAIAGLEAAGDLAEALEQGGIEPIELGVQRFALAGQQFVRGRYLMQQYLGEV